MKRILAIFAVFQCAFLLGVLAQQPKAPEAPQPGDEEVFKSDRRGHFRMHDRHAVGENVVVRTDEVVGSLVLFGGSADVRGKVDGDLVMIGGSVKVSGEITRGTVVIGGGLDVTGNIGENTVVVMGGADIKEGAKIEGNSVLIGGPFKIAEESAILGEKVTIPLGDVLPKILWFKAWVVKGLLHGRLLPLGVTWPWVVAGFTLLFYLLVLVLFPGSVKVTYTALEQQPVASLIAGFLSLILISPLVVILALTVVGIVAIPFVKIALLLALVVGKTAILCFLGRSLGRTIGGTALQAPFLAFITGAILLTFLYTIPVLGLIAWVIATLFGLGAAFVALGNSFSQEEAKVAPVSVPVGTLRPEPIPAGAPAVPVAAPAPESVALGFQEAGPVPVPTLTAADTLLLARAGFWRRFAAAFLDLILLIFGAIVFVPMIGPFYLLMAIGYFVGLWTWKGTTLGCIVVGLKIIRTDGRPLNFAVALVRSLSSFFSAIVLFLGFLWAAWDKEKQTWHDKIAGTIVVRMPQNFALL